MLILADLVVVPVLAVTVKVPVHDPVPNCCTVTHDVVVELVQSQTVGRDGDHGGPRPVER